MSDSEEEEINSLRTLVLNKTLIDHNCVAWISSCKNLEILEMADTRISGSFVKILSLLLAIVTYVPTADNLFQIILSCPRLSKLNLTGCRGVKISDRRRFFEVRALPSLPYVLLYSEKLITYRSGKSNKQPCHRNCFCSFVSQPLWVHTIQVKTR